MENQQLIGYSIENGGIFSAYFRKNKLENLKLFEHEKKESQKLRYY